MKLKYLGTAAAEAVPALFCECETCKKSRLLGGKNIRTRSQALINDDLLVDYPADTYMHSILHNIDLCKVKSCLITHSHEDHFYPMEIAMRSNGCFAHVYSHDEPLVFYSDKCAKDMLDEVIEIRGIKECDVQTKLVSLGEPFETQGYTVTSLRAAHDPKSDPVVYIIGKDGKSIFYSNDTSEYPEESMDYLAKLDKPLDLISLDCTEGASHTEYVGHLNLWRCIDLRQKLIELGAADEHTVFVLNHFSHNGTDVVYDDFVKIAAEYDFVVSYDGMEIEI